MVYYTQLIFVRSGEEQKFLMFEEHVLPLLAKYKGKLVLRLRPSHESVIETTVGRPYEVHLVSFPTTEDFAAYARDEKRQKYVPLKDESVESAMLIEGLLV
jgi:uncharacterized protein (DUF1330 family)